MKKLPLLFLTFFLTFAFVGNANAWDVCETSVETLEVASVVTFTSSFCNCLDGDVITIEITTDDPAITVDRVEFTKATPHWKDNQSWAEQVAVTATTADVLLHKVTDKTHTIHLWLYLSNGKHIGVNAHF